MKTVTFTHACQTIINGEPCEADVRIIYESGRSADDFIPVDDDAICAHGHVQSEVMLVTWWEEDFRAHCEQMYEQIENQRYYHQSGGL